MRAIVWCADHDGFSSHFMMEKSDFRYGRGNYEHVADVVRIERGGVWEGLRYRTAVCDSGERFHVFSDWSARAAIAAAEGE